MFSQFFGHYLLNRQLITADQLKEALHLQQSTHVKLGVLAVNEGLLTGTQVMEIHEKQKLVDQRFGEIAEVLGYLTDEQVEHLLSAQKHQHLQLAQALVDQSFMSIEEFSSALDSYKKEYGLSEEKFDSIKNGDIETLVETLLPLSDEKQKGYFTSYLSLFVKNMVRFIDETVYVDIHPLNGKLAATHLVSQEIEGEKSLFTAIGAEKEVFLKLASIYAEEKLEEVDELAKASVSEFLNLHNGIFLVNMSNEGTELEMRPQQHKENVHVNLVASGYYVQVLTSFGPFFMVLSDHPEELKVLRELTITQTL
jgi:CheY-specific phosphatase CheX